MLWFDREYCLKQYCNCKPWTPFLNDRLIQKRKTFCNCCKNATWKLNPDLPYWGQTPTDIWGSLVWIITAENSSLLLFIFLGIKYISSKLREFQVSRILFPTDHFISLCEFYFTCCLYRNGSQGWLCSWNCMVFLLFRNVYGMWDWKL